MDLRILFAKVPAVYISPDGSSLRFFVHTVSAGPMGNTDRTTEKVLVPESSGTSTYKMVPENFEFRRTRENHRHTLGFGSIMQLLGFSQEFLSPTTDWWRMNSV